MQVSIQLLLLFYDIQPHKCWSCRSFNTTFVTVLSPEPSTKLIYLGFQYNFCYCSIFLSVPRNQILRGFNTTFVTVLSSADASICSFSIGFNTTFVTVLFAVWTTTAVLCPVSIQLLLLFYPNVTESPRTNEKFQYNFCYCSIFSA